MDERKKRSPRDPEGRKRAIVEAAASLMSREGTKRLTHRRVAEAAGVPLGSTTQYFANLDELRREGLKELARWIERDYDEMFRQIVRNGGTDEAFAEALNEYLQDARQVSADVAFIAAAVHDPAIRQLYRNAFKSSVRQSQPFMTELQAEAFTLFMDGLTVDAFLLEEPPDPACVRAAVRAIMLIPGDAERGD